MIGTPFEDILRRAVERTPGAVLGAFADGEGEAVDCFVARPDTEWDVLTAHYGVVFAHIRSALNTFHYGEAETILLVHETLDILLHAVAEGYFALMVIRRPAALAAAMEHLSRASDLLREEMGA